jgi:hypothetical protein
MRNKRNGIAYNFKTIMLSIGVFIIIIVLLIIFVDYDRSVLMNENPTFQIWYLDPNFAWTPYPEKGSGMILSMIFNLIATFLCFVITLMLLPIRKLKQNHYLITNILITMILIGMARLFEVFYIITETDLRGVLYGIGRIFIPLDNLAAVIFFSVCFDVFFTEDLMKNPTLEKKFKLLALGTYLAGWIAILGFFSTSMILENIAPFINYVFLGIIIIVSIDILHRIRQLGYSIYENQKALRIIGYILILFIIVVILSFLLIITYANLFQYLMRTVKNILIGIIVFLFYPAFIKPAREALKI